MPTRTRLKRSGRKRNSISPTSLAALISGRRLNQAQPSAAADLGQCTCLQWGNGEMDIPLKARPVAQLRDYLAEERTFLAWIRTGISLRGFGFVVAHFGIFADEPQVTQQASGARP